MLRMIQVLAISLAMTMNAIAHDMDHPEDDAWYESLRQPNNPAASCCGVADAYWCDDVFTKGGKNFCRITDDRVVKGRTPRPLGQVIEIPDEKMMDGKKANGNPTGHSIIFLSSGAEPWVYCFILSGGI